MNILKGIKALFALKSVAKQMQPVPKSGFVSSEFWKAIFVDAALIAGVIAHFLNPNVAMIVSGTISIAYMIVRLCLKYKHVDLGAIAGISELSESQVLALLEAFRKEEPQPASATVTISGQTITQGS